MRGAVARALTGTRPRAEPPDEHLPPGLGRWLPPSRRATRPDLIAAAGIEFCRERRLLPLAPADGGGSSPLPVAAADPADRPALHELRRRLARPIEVVAASGGEIAVALDEALGLPAHASRRRLLAELGLLSSVEGDAYVAGAEDAADADRGQDEPQLGAALVEAVLLGEEERREAVALAFALPRVDLARRPPRPDLDALLPAATLRELRLVPLWHVGGQLFLEAADPPSASALARVEAECGLTARPLLADPAALSALLEERADSAEQERVSARDDDDDRAALLRAGVSRGQLEAAAALARELAIPLGEALERVAGVDAAAQRRARARAAGIAAFDGDLDAAPPEVQAALPPALARALRAVLVGRSGDEALVAMADPWDARARRALAALLGGRVRPLLASELAIEALLARLPTRQRGAPERGAGNAALEATPAMFGLLREAVFLEELASGDTDLPTREPAPSDLAALWAKLSAEERVEAWALAHGLPTVERLLWRARAAPAEVARSTAAGEAEAVLPLATLDALRLVAVAPKDDAPAEALPWSPSSVEDASGPGDRGRRWRSERGGARRAGEPAGMALGAAGRRGRGGAERGARGAGTTDRARAWRRAPRAARAVAAYRRARRAARRRDGRAAAAGGDGAARRARRARRRRVAGARADGVGERCG